MLFNPTNVVNFCTNLVMAKKYNENALMKTKEKYN
jgi:hypothetical protein